MKVIERDRIVDESAINLKVWRTWAKFQPKDSELREIQKMVPINFPSHFGLGEKKRQKRSSERKKPQEAQIYNRGLPRILQNLNKDLIMFLKPFL